MYNLTDAQIRQIENEYHSVISRENDVGIAGGAHYLLIHVLNQCGIYPRGTIEAKRICENILFSASDEHYAELAERME